MYHVLKDFAGPVATIIAATVAVFVTWRLGRGQRKIAEQQAATALDQLRYNLFEKRYEIYKDMQDLIRLLVNEADKADFRPFDVAPHYVVMDEAIFFFSESICAWIRELKDDCKNFLAARAARDRNPEDYADKMRRLVDHLTGMPKRFEQELGFRQLTQPPPR